MPALDGIDSLRAVVGQELGSGEWLTVSQDRIDAFAETTGDHQWIHVDPARAAAETPFGTTIAHGFLTLSLISSLLKDVVHVKGVRMSINYGLNRVRFVSPVPAGSLRSVVTSFKEANYIEPTGQPTGPAEAVIVLGAQPYTDQQADAKNKSVLTMTAQFDKAGAEIVATNGATGADNIVSQLRSDPTLQKTVSASR